MSASTRVFFSHPVYEPKHSLIDHLITVANRSEKFFQKTKFPQTKVAFYAGLLHDIGKLNPYYQELFAQITSSEIEESLLQKYSRVHSPLSAWAAKSLLPKTLVNKKDKIKIMLLVYSHHGSLRKALKDYPEDDKFIESKNATKPLIEEFSNAVSKMSQFDGLQWDVCLKEFGFTVDYEIDLAEYVSGIDEFMEMLILFSCLLQADRGSFEDHPEVQFDISINTSSQIRDSPLAPIRKEFQNQVEKNYDESQPISIIQAPTGIGKTKVFLDLLSRYKNHEQIHRIFYFSPLLALTDDFEGKIEQVVPDPSQLREILSYSHIFAGSIQSKKNFESGSLEIPRWSFENESFSRKFIITTTQRLLMTLFSNKSRDNLKLASLTNSLLIIDEVQTIPKYFLPTLKKVLLNLNKFLGSRIILVSATIPYELRDIHRINIDKAMVDRYLELTKKNIAYEQSLDIENIEMKRTLIMLNTRQKAANTFVQAKKSLDSKALYVTTGIRKGDRKDIIGRIKRDSEFVLVSTQVVEAGVDVSFSNVYREMCPLDNVIQVMGRLNREGRDKDAKLVVFDYDGMPLPYDEHEVVESRRIIRESSSSVQLYDSLEQYYKTISEQNKQDQKLAKRLDQRIEKLDFDGVWDFIESEILGEDDRDTVFVPTAQEWDKVRADLLNGLPKELFKKYGLLTASLPKTRLIDYAKMFDAELLEKEILLPKKEMLSEIYDPELGLDIWLTKK